MKKTTLFKTSVLILSVIFLTHCSKKLVEVQKTDFKDEIATQQNLTFTFSEALVADSKLGVWDTTSYIKFTPTVKGKFKWVKKNQLVFSPLQGFQPSTDYKAKLQDALVKSAPNKLPSVNKKSNIAFHTPYLDLEDADVFWTQDNRRTKQLRVNLNFNYKIKPQSIKNILTVKADGEQIQSYRVINDDISKTAQIVIDEAGLKNASASNIELAVAPGLRCAESEFTTKKPIAHKITTPNKRSLEIVHAKAEYENNVPYIRVQTNQAVEELEVLNNLKIKPSVVYQVKMLDHGFLIRGNFKANKSYTITLSDNIRGVFGGKLSEAHEQVVQFGNLSPYISFVAKNGLYLSSKGNKNVGIRIVNVPKVKVTVYKIYENNIQRFISERGYIRDNASSYYTNYSEYGDVVLEQDYDTKSLPQTHGMHVLNFDLDKANNFKGIYAVKVASTEKQWLNSNKIVSVSDIGFIVKHTANDVLVFANSIMNAKPLKGVSVSLISKSNQPFYKATTDANGVAKFANIKDKFPQANVRMITARYGKDFNYLHFNQTSVERSAFDIGGIRENKSGYQAFLYGERDLYRPGETINLNTIVRNKKWNTPGQIPIKLKLLLPNGKDFTSIRGVLDKQGSFATSIKLPTSVQTGTYNAEVYSATGVLLASKRISVEEFMPDRIKVKIDLTDKDYAQLWKQDLKHGDQVHARVEALNLFGPPAANRNYEMSFYLQRKFFQPEAAKYRDFNFNIRSSKDKRVLSTDYLKTERREGKTDKKGFAKESFKVPTEYAKQGVLQGKVYTTVFDETGRSVSRMKTFDVFTQKVFLGIKDFDYYVSTDAALPVNLVAVDKDGNPANTTAKVQVIRYRWQTVLEKTYDGTRYVSRRKAKILQENTLTLNGAATPFNFTPNRSGEYEIRVYLPNSEFYVAQSFYAYRYGSTDNASFEVDKDGKIGITMDKKEYNVGDQAKVLFTTPFKGRMLVTVERNQVFQNFYVDTDKKSASVTIPIKEAYLPNVYITATLIKPLSDGAIPLTVAHGFAPLKVVRPENRLKVSIDAVEKTESKQKRTIKVKTNRAESDIQVTLAVVDEGILQIKRYKTPNPFDYFFQKRALEVSPYDLYPKLFPELFIRRSSSGGGGSVADERANPMVNKRIKLVSFWSGILKTNAQGEASYTINIPQFSGSLRIMAVAYKGSAFGAAEKSMIVADPVVISTALPRFLSPGDQLKMPVTLTNTTEGNMQASVQLRTTPNLRIVSKNKSTIPLNANSEKQVLFEIEADKVIDSAKVEVVVNANGRIFTEKQSINIRPVSGLIKSSGGGVVSAGTNQSLDLKNDLIPSTTKAKLVISKSPLIQFTKNLDYLIKYPYGCVEQTTSSVFPQLYAQNLVKALMPRTRGFEATYGARIKENIQEGILRLQSMQMYNGALSYWPGGTYESWWGTAYATHFMLEAKKLGYNVNTSMLNRLYDYLAKQAKNSTDSYYSRNRVRYYYRDNNGSRKLKVIAKREAIYSLYILALAKKADVSTMNYYKENSKLLSLDAKYLLASAYYLLGDQVNYKALLPKSFSGEKAEQALGGSFYSYIRDQALALNALLEANPQSPQIGTLARRLGQQVRQARYLNTQESAFSLLALGKLANANTGKTQAEVTAGGRSVGVFSGQDLTISNSIAGKALNIRATGSGSLYYYWQMQGLSATGNVEEKDKVLRVRKQFYDRNGNEVKDGVFRQNDLVVVKITVNTTDGSNVENVALTDMLPAGFEIENPRLTSSSPAVSWIKRADNPQHFDIRDDRINLFATATRKTKTFYYLVRAVSRGNFKMGPVSADAMYSGEFYSYYGARTIKIVAKGGDEG
ncbi:hypothetical protein BKI52_32240 [marine bacterium AO1-C]|nr:hypothetical protein BKI52_32240 [marine bacterium AO1-C]